MFVSGQNGTGARSTKIQRLVGLFSISIPLSG
jgi:hypothetical protein